MRGFLAKPGQCVFNCGREIFVWDTLRNLWASWKVAEFATKVGAVIMMRRFDSRLFSGFRIQRPDSRRWQKSHHYLGDAHAAF